MSPSEDTNIMTIVAWQQVEKFKQTHAHCILDTKLTNDDKDTVVIRCAYHAQTIVACIPYRMFCHNPRECAGRHSCPRDYACSE